MTRAQNPEVYHLAVAGGGRGGKTSLLTKFALDQFGSAWGPVIEDSYRKLCAIGDRTAYVDVLDIIGDQESFEAMRDPWRSALTEGFLLVYSITSRESFEEVTAFYQHILRFKEKGSFSVLLVANKCDLEFEREVGIHEGRDLANHLGCGFIETSAKNGIRVDEAFVSLAMAIRERKRKQRAGQPAPQSTRSTAPRRGPGDRSGSCRGGCVIL